MRTIQYDMTLSLASLVILMLIMTHNSALSRLEDRNNRLFRRLLMMGFLDISLDILSVIVPAIEALHAPLLYTIINSCYNELNVIMCYTVLFYTESLRDNPKEKIETKHWWMLLPAIVALAMLIVNFPTHWMFWYDELGNHYSGPLGKFTYVMAAIYFFESVMTIKRYSRDYSKERRRFMHDTFLLLGVCILMQLVFPQYLCIDLGIGLSTLSFYLFNNNPVQYVDTLTGAFDKNYFDTWVQDQLSLEKRLYLIAVSLKNLQNINAVQGEKYGNHVLAEIAGIMKQYDDDGSVFRLSGSCLMIHCHNGRRYRERMDSLREKFNNPDNQSAEIRESKAHLLGIQNAEMLIPDYSILTFVEYLNSQIDVNDDIVTESSAEALAGFRYEMEIERYLREAIDKNRFTLDYQPIWSLKEKRYVSVEALSRLNHPTLGRLNPQKVINIAERSGMIDEVTDLQFRNLCRYMKENPDVTEKLDRFKFNLSPLNLLDHENIARLIDIAEENGLPFDKFEFEFTESFATEENEELYEIIRLVQDKGICLSLDDFGSGYSNLSNVLTLPFTNIKFDRSLLLEISHDQNIAVFYKGIVKVMQSFGMKIICEGVETEHERNLLDSWGADMIQGYYYSKPRDGESLKTFLYEKEGSTEG